MEKSGGSQTLPARQAVVARATQAVRQSTGGLIRGLKVEALEHGIVITGTTDLYYHKQLVTRAVLDACQEDSLHNNIVVNSI